MVDKFFTSVKVAVTAISWTAVGVVAWLLYWGSGVEGGEVTSPNGNSVTSSDTLQSDQPASLPQQAASVNSGNWKANFGKRWGGAFRDGSTVSAEAFEYIKKLSPSPSCLWPKNDGERTACGVLPQGKSFNCAESNIWYAGN